MAANRQANRWESDGESSDDDDDDLPRRKKRCLMLAAAVAVLVDAPTQHSGPRGPKRRQQMCFFAMGGEKKLSSKIEVFFDLCN